MSTTSRSQEQQAEVGGDHFGHPQGVLVNSGLDLALLTGSFYVVLGLPSPGRSLGREGLPSLSDTFLLFNWVRTRNRSRNGLIISLRGYAPFFEPDPSEWVSGPSSGGNQSKTKYKFEF